MISIQSQLNINSGIEQSINQSHHKLVGNAPNRFISSPLINNYSSIHFRSAYFSHSSQSPPSFIHSFSWSIPFLLLLFENRWSDFGGLLILAKNSSILFFCPFVSIFQPKIHLKASSPKFSLFLKFFVHFPKKQHFFCYFDWSPPQKGPNLINLLPLFLSPPPKILHQSA